MKLIKQSVIAVALISSSLVLADEPKDPIKTCTEFSELVEYVAKIRYAGGELPSLLSSFDDKGMQEIILMVYNEPRMRAKENQEDQIARLKEDAFMACYQELKWSN